MSAARISENDELVRWVSANSERALQRKSLPIPDAATAVRIIPHLRGQYQGAVGVTVPSEADQLERLVVDVATQVGDPGASFAIDEALRGNRDLAGALQKLTGALGDRVLILDGRRVGAFGETELKSAFAQRIQTVTQWLEGISRRIVVTVSPGARGLERPPLTFSNGHPIDASNLWDRCGARLGSFSLALARRALLGDEGDVGDDPAEEEQVRADIADALPPTWRRAHATVAIHARPLPVEVAAELEIEPALSSLVDLGLCHRDAERWRLEEGWTRFWANSLPPKLRLDLRLRLADALARRARPTEPEAWREGLAILEAHRHLSRTGQWRRAMDYARYGVSALVEVARRRSIQGDYALAAEIYGGIVSVLEQKRVPGPQRLLGYARHYLHFNLARAGTEPLDLTVHGYRASVDAWPENALFWSRLARAEFYRERQAEALDSLDQARHSVPEHAEKDSVLVARTARGLLEHDRVAEAVLVWARYEPDTAPAVEIASLLDAATTRGWFTRRLLLRETALHFNRELRVSIEPFSRGYRASLPELELQGDLRDARDGALASLVERVRAEVEQVLVSFTHQLKERERARKQKLLSAVDIVASGLLRGREVAWVFGELRRDDTGSIWLETGANTLRSYEVPSALVEGPLGDHLWFAEVVCNPPGVPFGPVRKLERAVGSKDVWSAWTARMHDAEE